MVKLWGESEYTGKTVINWRDGIPEIIEKTDFIRKNDFQEYLKSLKVRI